MLNMLYIGHKTVIIMEQDAQSRISLETGHPGIRTCLAFNTNSGVH